MGRGCLYFMGMNCLLVVLVCESRLVCVHCAYMAL